MTGREKLMAYLIFKWQSSLGRICGGTYFKELKKASEKLQTLANNLANCLILKTSFIYFQWKNILYVWSGTI